MKIKEVTIRIYTEDYNYKYTLGYKKIWQYEGTSDNRPKAIKIKNEIETREEFENIIAGIEESG